MSSDVQKSKRPSEAQTHLSRIWSRDPVALLAFIGSLVAMGMTAFQLYSSELATERSQRAWLGVERAEFGNLIPGDKPVLSMSFFKNTGPTPAVKVRPKLRVLLTAEPLDWNFGDIGEESIGVVVPGGVASAGRRAPTLSADDMKDLVAGTKHVYMWGVVVYEDVFQKQRETKFCFKTDRPDPVHGPVTNQEGSWAAVSCGFGNEMR